MDSVLMDRSSPSLEAGAPSGQAGLEGMINEPVRKPSGVVTQKLKNTGSGEEVSHDGGIYASPSETPQRRSAHPEDLRLGVESRLSELENKTKQRLREGKTTPQNELRQRLLPSRPSRQATAPGHSCTRGSAPTLESAQPGERAPRVHGRAARVQDP
ncbi:hypothetical protein CapIbe_012234 [Capra ibex]